MRRIRVASWWLYDVANTLFAMGVESLFFSLWIREHVGPARADRIFGLLTGTAMGLTFVLSPFLGALSDRTKRRMPFLFVSTAACVLCTVYLGRGGLVVSAILFIAAVASYNAGLLFYDSLLASVSTPQNRGRVGGIGVGLGYLGSFLAVGYGLMLPGADKHVLFSLIALSFFVLAVPCFVFVREKENPHPWRLSFETLRETVLATIGTIRRARSYPGLLRFLLGRFFYTDAINTVIAIMGLYCVNIATMAGLGRAEAEREVYHVMMAAIFFAIPGGFIWGRLTDRWGPKRTLKRVLILWLFTLALASAVGFFGLPMKFLYLVAIMAGIGLGGTWSADRPLMLLLAPPERVGEFYGLYGMVGRFSALTGPFIWAFMTHIATSRLALAPAVGQSAAILVLLGFIAVGYAFIRGVPDSPGTLGPDDSR